MKITISSPTSGNVVLADDLNVQVLTGPSGLKFSGTNQEQAVAPMRSESMQFIDRGNRQTDISFTVVRKHANTKDAEYFLITHERELPRRGTVTFTAKNALGNEVSAYLAGAMITPQSSYIGVTTRHSYQLHGGVLLIAPPSS